MVEKYSYFLAAVSAKYYCTAWFTKQFILISLTICSVNCKQRHASNHANIFCLNVFLTDPSPKHCINFVNKPHVSYKSDQRHLLLVLTLRGRFTAVRLLCILVTWRSWIHKYVISRMTSLGETVERTLIFFIYPCTTTSFLILIYEVRVGAS